MEALAEKLPAGFKGEWTGIAYEQKQAGNVAALVFGMAVLFVFLVLAAQFESLILPLAIILIVPMTLLAAMAGVNIRGMDNNILTQIGLIVLVALAAKNAILIVEFAIEEENHGKKPLDATLSAVRMRLRPIIMTSLAFIGGMIPLFIASGAGAASRIAVGTGVIGGMLGATILGVFFIPLFYLSVRHWLGKEGVPPKAPPGSGGGAAAGSVHHG